MQKLLKEPDVVIFAEQSDHNDLRFKNIVRSWTPEISRANIGIVGIPFDLGVKNSAGRIGAAEAPDAIRLQIKRYGTTYNTVRGADLSALSIADFGNVNISSRSVAKTHYKTTEAVKALLAVCDVVIVLGGGNDLTYATVRALKEICEGQIGGMNVDAHLDVREVRDDRISSGTPFRRLIEHKIIEGKNLFEIGLQAQVNSKYHWEWAEKQGVRLVPLPVIREYPQGIKVVLESFKRLTEHLTALFVSIDIDSIAQAFAPGSSAPNPDGLFPQEILALAHEVGKMPNVKLFEIMEVNPLFDQDNRTSRLAVNIILEFLAGYTKRR